MKNVEFVQSFESQSDVDQSFPNGLLVEHGLRLLVRDNLLIEVAVVRILHYDAE